MKIAFLFFTTFLTVAAYDLNLFRRRHGFLHTPAEEVLLTLTEEETAVKKKAVRRLHGNVVPRRFREFKRPVRSKCNTFNAAPMDPRYSDQRKIRRRINNL